MSLKEFVADPEVKSGDVVWWLACRAWLKSGTLVNFSSQPAPQPVLPVNLRARLGEGQTRSPNRTRRPTLTFHSAREDATELRCLVASQPPSCWTGSVVRAAIRIFFKPAVILLIDLLILVPILLSIVSIVADLLGGKLDLPMDIQEEIGVVLIGWGVAMEERVWVRQIFRLHGHESETLLADIPECGFTVG